MAGKQRFYRDRIRSTQALKKIFRAMELMAASRISKARASLDAAGPYARAITQAVSAVVGHAEIDHPLTRERPESTRTAVLLVTADRGMADDGGDRPGDRARVRPGRGHAGPRLADPGRGHQLHGAEDLLQGLGRPDPVTVEPLLTCHVSASGPLLDDLLLLLLGGGLALLGESGFDLLAGHEPCRERIDGRFHLRLDLCREIPGLRDGGEHRGVPPQVLEHLGLEA